MWGKTARNEMDKIIIRDLLSRGRIGIGGQERERPQDILINAELFYDSRRAAESDDIADCVNYAAMTKKLLKAVEENQRKTVEALAQDLADICLEHELVLKVKMRVEKTSIVRFASAVGIEIEREK